MGLGAAVAGGLTALGVGAETAGILAPVLVGSAVGTVGAAATGGNIGEGALFGGLTGGLGELGGVAGDALGIGSTAGDVFGSAAGGAIGSAATGGNPLTGALTSGAGAGLTSALGGPISAGGGGPGFGSDLQTVTGDSTGIQPLDASQISVGGSGGTTATNGGVNNIATGAGSPINLDTLTATATGGGNGATAGLNGVSPLTGSAPLTVQPTTQYNGPVSIPTLPAGGTAAAAGGGGNSFSNFINNPSLSTAGSFLSNNAAPLLAGAGLLYNLEGTNQIPGQSALQTQADQLAAQGQQLSSYVNTGKLPAGAQTAINQAAESAKAETRSRFAALGLTGSTMEASALAEIDQNVATQGFSIAQQLLQTGIQETGLADNIYTQLLQLNEQQSQATGQAIASFASALGGFGNGRSITINTGGSGG